MKTNHFFTSLLVLILTLVLSGCAGMSPTRSLDLACTSTYFNGMLDSKEYSKKHDNFLIIQDATTSMNDRITRGQYQAKKLELSKELLLCMNNTLPDNFDMGAGMRVFGTVDSGKGLIYGMSKYNKTALENAVLSVGGPDYSRTTLGDAIIHGTNDLTGTTDRTAVIIFSDGIVPEKIYPEKDKPSPTSIIPLDPAASAAKLKDTYGDNVCIYTVFFGDNDKGRATMEEIAAQGKCGFAVDANSLYTGPLTDCDTVYEGKGMIDFVTRVFLEADSDKDGVGNSIDECPNTPLGVKVDAVGCPLDKDGDGVPDYLDNCPDTPVGTKVDSLGCPMPDIDSDGDGVLDLNDRCPNTPKGIKVDEFGCPIPLLEKVTVTLYVGFDFDKVDIKNDYRENLEKVGNLLIAYPETGVDLEGHTDSTGPEEYNMGLSMRRAESVKKDLVGTYNIDASRISTHGYGESSPAASNDTVEGRMENRRVVATIEAMVKK